MRSKNSEKIAPSNAQKFPSQSYKQSNNRTSLISLNDKEKVFMEFKYNFQDYLKMALCKLIPCQGVVIDPQQEFIYGSKDDCVKLKKKVQKELSSKKYKKIEFKKETDLDQIEYQLDSKFDPRIFREGFMGKALNALSYFNSLELSCSKFRQLIRQKNIIILRVKADYEGECMDQLQRILKKIDEQGQNKKYDESQEYEEIVDDQVHYYQIEQERMVEEVNESHHSNENNESSFTLTQTNSSEFMDEEMESLTSINQTVHEDITQGQN